MVGRNTPVDKLKGVRVRSGALPRNNPNSLMARYNFIALFDVEEFYRARGCFASINRDGTVDHHWLHLDLFALQPDECLLVRRNVKIVGEDPIGRRTPQLGFRFLHDFGPMLP